MRKLAIAALAVTLVGALAPAVRGGTESLALVRVPIDSRDEALFLTSSFDETHDHGPGHVELLLWPGDAARLERAGFHDYEVVIEDVVAHDAALDQGGGEVIALPGPDRNEYRRWSDYQSEAKELSRNRDLVRLLRLPNPTLEGREVVAIEIADDVRADDGRPTFYVDGIHHAREWPAAEYPMIFAHYLVENYGKDARVTRLLKRVRVVVVPVVNPDGFDYSRESPVQQSLLGSGNGFEGYWRKNRRSLTGITVPAAQKNPDAYGVDPNRNYGFLWGDDIGGSSGVPVTTTYRGEAPFSEPEPRNVRSVFLGRHVTGIVTNHTSGNLVLRPWGHTAKDAPDETFLRNLGARVARAMGGYENIKGIHLYATTGTTDDWAYAATGSLGYTFEHGQAFHPPYQTEIGTSWRGVMNAYLLVAEAAADPDRHGVIKGRVVDAQGRPVNAHVMLRKTFKTPLWDGNPTGKKAIRERIDTHIRTGADGRFEWHVNPSTRPLVEARGDTESYRLVISTSGPNCSNVERSVTIGRGRVRDLGLIKLGVAEVCSARLLKEGK